MKEKEKVVIFAPFSFAPMFLGLSLEFLQREVENGNEVVYLDCSQGFHICGFNTYGLKYMCEICVKRFSSGSQLIQGSFQKISFKDILSDADREYAAQKLANVVSIEKNLVIDGFDVGESVHSSMISKTKEKEFTNESDKFVLKNLAQNSLELYHALLRYLEEHRADKMILFNGRWDYYRAALCAGRRSGLKPVVIENFRAGGYYEVFDNVFPHDLNGKNKLIAEHWANETDRPKKEKIASDFFEKKRRGEAVVDKSYTAHQKRGLLPDFVDLSKKLIVIFNSSDYEFEAVGKEYANPFFKGQAEAIEYVAQLVSHYPEYQLVVRMHPNLIGLERNFLKPIYELKGRYTNVFVVDPPEKVDSYALMDQAYKVCTFVSTIGIEANYWRKPVVLLGKCIYSEAGIAYSAKSVEEIKALLLEELEPMPKENSEKFAYYYLTGGSRAKYYSTLRGGEVTFKDISLSKLPQSFRLYYKVLKFLNVRNK